MQNPAQWGVLMSAAVPIVDYTFDKVTVTLDLKSAKGKAEAVEKLMPIISPIKDAVRQTYYIDKLAGLVGQSPKKLELMLFKSRGGPQTKSAVAEARRVSVANPVEEYCLAIK